MNLYIHGIGILSAAGNNGTTEFLQQPPEYYTDRLLCKEPDYSAFIPPMQLRRMSKAVRMGIGAAKICLQDAGVARADAISVGTAFGCLHDTEVFLSKMVDQDEQMLTPTAFIQSTHNTVAGQIALVTGCHGHNLTYVHRGHSFEHAMMNAQLYLNDHTNEQMLVGAIEELTETSIGVLQEARVYRKQAVSPGELLSEHGAGSIAGEGATFFLVNSRQSAGAVKITDIATFETRDTQPALGKVQAVLKRNQLEAGDIDLLLLGINGDERSKDFYSELRNGFFAGNSHASFKQLCGEYPVSSAFGLGVFSWSVKHGLPEGVLLTTAPQQLKRVLLVNNFLHHYSCWLLEIA